MLFHRSDDLRSVTTVILLLDVLLCFLCPFWKILKRFDRLLLFIELDRPLECSMLVLLDGFNWVVVGFVGFVLVSSKSWTRLYGFNFPLGAKQPAPMVNSKVLLISWWWQLIRLDAYGVSPTKHRFSRSSWYLVSRKGDVDSIRSIHTIDVWIYSADLSCVSWLTVSNKAVLAHCRKTSPNFQQRFWTPSKYALMSKSGEVVWEERPMKK